MTGYCASGKRHQAIIKNGEAMLTEGGAQICVFCGYVENQKEVEQRKARTTELTRPMGKLQTMPGQEEFERASGKTRPLPGLTPAPGPTLLCFTPEAHNALMAEAFRKGAEAGELSMVRWLDSLSQPLLRVEDEIQDLIVKAKVQGWDNQDIAMLALVAKHCAGE